MSEYKDIGLYDGDSGFVGAIGKIHRARFQLNDLEERFRKVVEGRAYRIAENFQLRPDQDIGDYTFTIQSATIPNREWGVLVGELVHNLRSALDHCVYASARKPDGTYFPTFTKEMDWDRKSCDILYSVPEKVVEIIKEAQPYRWKSKAAEHPLAILNTLWNHDKHRLLHTTALTLAGPQPAVVAVSGVDEIISQEVFTGRSLKNDAKIAQAVIRPLSTEPKMQLNGKLSLGVAFAKRPGSNSAIGGVDVIGVLGEAWLGHEGIITVETLRAGGASEPCNARSVDCTHGYRMTEVGSVPGLTPATPRATHGIPRSRRLSPGNVALATVGPGSPVSLSIRPIFSASAMASMALLKRGRIRLMRRPPCRA